jgi:hypothetical protein
MGSGAITAHMMSTGSADSHNAWHARAQQHRAACAGERGRGSIAQPARGSAGPAMPRAHPRLELPALVVQRAHGRQAGLGLVLEERVVQHLGARGRSASRGGAVAR